MQVLACLCITVKGGKANCLLISCAAFSPFLLLPPSFLLLFLFGFLCLFLLVFLNVGSVPSLLPAKLLCPAGEKSEVLQEGVANEGRE